MKEILCIRWEWVNQVPDCVKKDKVLKAVHSERPTTLGGWDSERLRGKIKEVNKKSNKMLLIEQQHISQRQLMYYE